jgi:hypothetical protein
MNPRPSRKDSIRVFLKAARSLCDCSTFLDRKMKYHKSVKSPKPESSGLISSPNCPCCDCNVKRKNHPHICQENPHKVFMQPTDRCLVISIEPDIGIHAKKSGDGEQGQDQGKGNTISNKINEDIKCASFENPCDRVVEKVSLNSYNK